MDTTPYSFFMEDLDRKRRWRRTDMHKLAEEKEKEMGGPWFPREYYEWFAQVQRLFQQIEHAGMNTDQSAHHFRLYGVWGKGIFLPHMKYLMQAEEAREWMQVVLRALREDFLGWLNMNTADRSLFIGKYITLHQSGYIPDEEVDEDIVYQRWLKDMIVEKNRLGSPCVGHAWYCDTCRTMIWSEKHVCADERPAPPSDAEEEVKLLPRKRNRRRAKKISVLFNNLTLTPSVLKFVQQSVADLHGSAPTPEPNAEEDQLPPGPPPLLRQQAIPHYQGLALKRGRRRR